MNPLTQIRNTQKATRRERDLGIGQDASWHARFRHSAYIYVGGLDYELTEGDLLAVFAQYGEVVDVNLIKDKATGTSKGFAFLAYENQKSTVLAVDNLSGTRVAGRIIRVEHVDDYKRRREEGDEDSPKRQRREVETPSQPKRETQEATVPQEPKRAPPEEEGGSLFDQMSAHLKKKQKSFPVEEEETKKSKGGFKSAQQKPFAVDRRTH